MLGGHLTEAHNILQENMLIGLLLLLLSLAVITDVTHRKIPNLLIVSGLVTALIGQLFLAGGQGWQAWLLGMLAGFAVFLPLYLLRGMAAGDVKLMMVVGGFLGFPLVLTAALYCYAAGGIMAIIIVLAKGRFKQVTHNIKMILTPLYIRATSGVDVSDGLIKQVSVGRMPYAVAIGAGTLLTLYLK